MSSTLKLLLFIAVALTVADEINTGGRADTGVITNVLPNANSVKVIKPSNAESPHSADTAAATGPAVGKKGDGSEPPKVKPPKTTAPPPIPTTAATTEAPAAQQLLPEKGAAEKEHHSSMRIYFILLIIGK